MANVVCQGGLPTRGRRGPARERVCQGGLPRREQEGLVNWHGRTGGGGARGGGGGGGGGRSERGRWRASGPGAASGGDGPGGYVAAHCRALYCLAQGYGDIPQHSGWRTSTPSRPYAAARAKGRHLERPCKSTSHQGRTSARGKRRAARGGGLHNGEGATSVERCGTGAGTRVLRCSPSTEHMTRVSIVASETAFTHCHPPPQLQGGRSIQGAASGWTYLDQGFVPGIVISWGCHQ